MCYHFETKWQFLYGNFLIFIYLFLFISDVRIEGGIIPIVLAQRGGVVRNLKKTRSTREGLPLSLPQSLLLHVKVNGINKIIFDYYY